MRSLWGPVLTLLAGAAMLAAGAAVALSAPAPVKAPSISGTPAFGSVLTCNRGTWSADALGFDYSWVYAGGGATIASGRTWHVDGAVGYNVLCHVVAHDAGGATAAADSPPVLIGKGISTIRILKVMQRHGQLTFTCVAGPKAALAHGSFDRPYAVLDRRLSGNGRLQLGGLKTIKTANGAFTISGHDTPGQHTYIVEFVPAPSSQFAFSSATKKLTVTR